jgi:BirA family biotin operon repressor/biotin-[acetyl-CoA-carboxylase] ligase
MMSDAARPAGDRGLGPRLAATRFGPVRWFDEIDSTNRYAVAEVLAGAPAGLVIVADVQQAGRGRLGRTWQAPPGSSLLVSVLVEADTVTDLRPLVTPAAALAAADALRSLAGIDARLKWPNDLVVGDRKLAGLLAEVVGSRPTVVVGMGCNVSWPSFPDDLADIATSCNLLSDRPVDRADLLVEWLTRYDVLLTQLETAAGRAALRDGYADRSATLGRRVRVEMSRRAFEGVATGVLEDGTLEVTRDDGVREAVAAGDVIHLRPT